MRTRTFGCRQDVLSVDRPQVVCLTPVKNEAWILRRFLDAAATWADLIVVADQMSTDGSREIADSHPKVVVIENDGSSYDESARQRLLLDAARRLVPGPRVFVALDADEALTSDVSRQPEWHAALNAPAGTTIRMRWINVMPGGPEAWLPPDFIVFGFVDDGSEHGGERIHNPRLPMTDDRSVRDLEAVGVIHLQYCNAERMRSKQRWYQAWERVELETRRPIQIYRRYHRMDAIDPAHRGTLQSSWFDDYVARGIDLLAPTTSAAYHWDAEVMNLVEKYGGKRFRRVDLWSVDWGARATALGRTLPDGLRKDPRSRIDRLVLAWLAWTQESSARRWVRWIQRLLRIVGW
jgi:glycosyltransferase involved in cell wall biosynthesis